MRFCYASGRGHGANRPVTPGQLSRALSLDKIDILQQQIRMNSETLLSQLAQALPEVVHALTPRRRVRGAEEQRE